MDVTIDVRGGQCAWDTAAVEKLARFALVHMGVPQAAELSISMVDKQEIQQLNRDYRGNDCVTDVLSFECDDPWGEYAPGEEIAIGDVVICTDVVDEQRSAFGTSFEQEASLMLVHSILHLLGYDHMEPDERAEMEAKEKEILDAYGLTGVR